VQLLNVTFSFRNIHTMAPTVICDPEGDLRLKVGAQSHPREQLEFIVSSKALSRASRPFKKMLYGNFRESMKATSTTENWVVELPEDSPYGMAVLLHIIHSEDKLVCEYRITLVQLYRILVVSEKYDVTHVLGPWVNAWFKPHAKLAKNRKLVQDPEIQEPEIDLLLRVAWELGADDVFKHVAMSMCLECEVNSRGQLLDFQKDPLEGNSFLEPPGLFGMQID
jgi:hypothetical protein